MVIGTTLPRSLLDHLEVKAELEYIHKHLWRRDRPLWPMFPRPDGIGDCILEAPSTRRDHMPVPADRAHFFS